jgi:hypothetical protein
VKLFRNTFIKHFDKNELQKKEDEVVKGFESMSVQPAVYLSTLTEQEQELLEKSENNIFHLTTVYII